MTNDKFWNSRISLLRLAEIVIVLAIIISGFILFAYEREHNNPDYQKSWVAFYFVDPGFPAKGVAVENHLGQETSFQLCLVPDSDNLIEPKDLSCTLSSVAQFVTKNITAGSSETWLYPLPDKQGKYWVVAEYKDQENVLRSKDLSFDIK